MRLSTFWLRSVMPFYVFLWSYLETALNPLDSMGLVMMQKQGTVNKVAYLSISAIIHWLTQVM